MNRTILFGIATMVALVGIALMGEQKQAVAGHGCYGCYGGYRGAGFVNRPYLGWRIRYVGLRLHQFIWHGGYGGYGTYYGGHGYYGYPVSYAYSGCYGCYGCVGYQAYYHAVPRRAAPPTPRKTDDNATKDVGEKKDAAGKKDAGVKPPTPGPGEDAKRSSPSETRLTVSVPADAKIIVNGIATRTPGTRRDFIARGLAPGARYGYHVVAKITRGGETMTETKYVKLAAGQSGQITFDFSASLAKKDAEKAKRRDRASVVARTR